MCSVWPCSTRVGSFIPVSGSSGYSPSSCALTGSLVCSVASRLRLIIANSGACSEGGVSSLSSDPPTGSHTVVSQGLVLKPKLRKILFFELHDLFFCFRVCIVLQRVGVELQKRVAPLELVHYLRRLLFFAQDV